MVTMDTSTNMIMATRTHMVTMDTSTNMITATRTHMVTMDTSTNMITATRISMVNMAMGASMITTIHHSIINMWIHIMDSMPIIMIRTITTTLKRSITQIITIIITMISMDIHMGNQIITSNMDKSGVDTMIQPMNRMMTTMMNHTMLNTMRIRITHLIMGQIPMINMNTMRTLMTSMAVDTKNSLMGTMMKNIWTHITTSRHTSEDRHVKSCIEDLVAIDHSRKDQKRRKRVPLLISMRKRRAMRMLPSRKRNV